MSKSASIGLFVAVACAAFAVGVTVRRSRKGEIPSRQPVVKAEGRESDRVQAFLADVRNLRRDLTRKERRIRYLEAELAELYAEYPPPIGPAEEGLTREKDTARAQQERDKALWEKSRELRERILQRKDKHVRAQALEELAALLVSDTPQDIVLGLFTLPSLEHIKCDKERFRQHVLGAFAHEGAEVRRMAVNSLPVVCTSEEVVNIALSMVPDPAPEVRGLATRMVFFFAGSQRNEEVASALGALLEDQDRSVKREALGALSRGYDYGEEMEDQLIELSKDPLMVTDVLSWWARRKPEISADVAQRLVEMAEEGLSERSIISSLDPARLSEEAKPVASRFYLQVLRQSLSYYERTRAVGALRRMGDASVLPELEEIAGSDDAEGIQEELARTIEHLRQ